MALVFELHGRSALVTGAGQGIGAAIAAALAAQGAAVIVNDVAGERARAVVAEIESHGGNASPAVADVTDGPQLEEALGRATAGRPVDILINNAGVPTAGFSLERFVDADPLGWAPILSLNLHAVLTCTRLVLPSMITNGWGRIITVVSEAGRVGTAGCAVYGAAKAGAAGFSRGLALEVGEAGVTCNCVSLGTVESASTPIDPDEIARRTRRYARRRWGRPDEVAAAVVWLASDEADWVTGQTIPVNGGYATS